MKAFSLYLEGKVAEFANIKQGLLRGGEKEDVVAS